MLFQDITSGRISDGRARGLIQRLYELKYISLRESRLMEAVLDGLSNVNDKSLQETLRGRLLKDMILMLIKLA
jgi:transcriptional regulator CtsR